MLTRYDEYFCHQIASTFDHPGTSDRNWTERIWLGVHDTTGKVLLVGGFGKYANRNISDAYGSVVIDGKTQYTVRASRELRPQIDEVNVGPFSWEILEELKRVRVSLAEIGHGVSYDIEFDGSMPPWEEGPKYVRVRGRVQEDLRRFIQLAKPSGWIKIKGETYHIDKQNWLAERDRSWGVRHMAGDEAGQPNELPVGLFYNWVTLHFPKWGATYYTREDPDGHPYIFSGAIMYPYGSGKEELKLISIEHDYKFRSDIRQLKSGRLVLNTVNNSKIEMSVRVLGVCYQSLGGYSPGWEGFVHGKWMGPSFNDCVKLDLTNSDQERRATFYEDFVCEFRCGDEVGYGMMELVVLGKYPKYGYMGW